MRTSVLVVLLLACLIAGLLWWFDPSAAGWPVCTFYALTGLKCPLCGATRATHELLHGRLLAAWHYNALWMFSLPVAAYMAISELRLMSGRRPLPGDLLRKRWFWMVGIAAAVAFFVVRNLPQVS